MKKKLTAIGLVCAMLVSLAACSSTAPAAQAESAPSGGAAAETQETEKTDASGEVYDIAFVPKEEADQWFKHMEEGELRYGELSGQHAYEAGPSSLDASLQVQIITDLTAQSVDAICVVPIDPEALTEVCNTARAAGIPVIAHEAEEMASADFDIEPIGGLEYGAAMMDKLAEIMDYKGKYACCPGELTSVSHMLWMEGAIARAEEAYPDMVLADAGIFESGDNQERAYERTKELMKSEPDIEGILFSADVGGIGGAIALDDMGLAGKVHVVATGMPSISGQYVTDGLMDAIICWDPAKTAIAMGELAEFILNNGVEAVGTEFHCQYAEGYETITREEDSNTFYGTGVEIWTAEDVEDPDRYF